MYATCLAILNTRITTRGYTNHEMLDEVGLIHMNGRLYNAKLARFVSADPLIPDPMNTQSYNRYSYVRNQPTYFTDPSGYQEREPEEVRVTGVRKGDVDDGSVTIEGDLYDDYAAALDAFGTSFDDGSTIGVYEDAEGEQYAIVRGKNGNIVNAKVTSLKAFLKVSAKNPSVGIVDFLKASGGLVYPVIGPKGVSIGQRESGGPGRSAVSVNSGAAGAGISTVLKSGAKIVAARIAGGISAGMNAIAEDLGLKNQGHVTIQNGLNLLGINVSSDYSKRIDNLYKR